NASLSTTTTILISCALIRGTSIEAGLRAYPVQPDYRLQATILSTVKTWPHTLLQTRYKTRPPTSFRPPLSFLSTVVEVDDEEGWKDGSTETLQ
ncbi:hypothetical protein BC629DRAFT_1729030, partial [Irpex lacteus]